MSNKINLSDLEKAIRANNNSRLTREESLAMLAYARELESSLESVTEIYRPIDAEPQWHREDKARSLFARGCVLP